MDMTQYTAAKSDQLNSDDLIAGPRTITITKVKANEGNKEQPVNIFFEGDDGKPFRPCLSMRRVMIAVWGSDAAQYVGRSMTIYRDPSVTWGGMEVGGIRISNMSHMDGPVVLALTATKKARKPYKVLPLVIEPPKPATDAAADVARELVGFADSIENADAMAEFEANPSITKRRDRLRDVRPELSRDVEAAVMAARARVAPAAKVEDGDVPF
jgi:hypothetical protein